MKFYKKEGCNLIFTVKNGASLHGLKEVEKQDIVSTIKSFGLSWVNQPVDSPEQWSFILRLADNLIDERIHRFVDIAHTDSLSYECDEVICLQK